MRNVIIISAEQAGLPEQVNLMATNELASVLEWKPVIGTGTGMYKGSKEAVFAVRCCSNFTLEDAETIARQFKQESILFVDEGGCACLMYVDGSAKYDILGQFQLSTKEYAERADSYTKIGGKFYVAK